MAVWQVDFEVIPSSALGRAPRPLTADVVASTPWWDGVRVSTDFKSQLDAIAPRASSQSPDLETWGAEEGNRIDVWSEQAEVKHVVARVDVRRLDAKFGAALLMLLKRLGATLVRRDGLVVEPTIGAFAAALRSSAAWRYANDTATWLESQRGDTEADE